MKIRTQMRSRHRMRRLPLVIGALTLSTLSLTQPTYADSVVWTGIGNDNLWSTGANWIDIAAFSTGVPTSADTILIGSGSTVNVSIGNAAAGSLSNSGSVSVGNLYSLNVAQDIFNAGSLQASGAMQGPGVAFTDSASIPGLYDLSVSGIRYGAVSSSVSLLGGGNQFSNTGTLLAQNGGFIGSQYNYDSTGNLLGASGTYGQATNAGLMQADGGQLYRSQDSISVYTNMNPVRYGITGQVVTTALNSWQSSTVQLDGGGAGSSFTNQAGSTILSSNGGTINLSNYEMFHNQGGLIQADGESAVFTAESDRTTVTNLDGSTGGPYNAQYDSIGYSAITLSNTGLGTLNNTDSARIAASNGGSLFINGFNTLNNDASSAIAASGYGPRDGAFSLVSISLNSALNNSGLVSATNGGRVSLSSFGLNNDGLILSAGTDPMGSASRIILGNSGSANQPINNDVGGSISATNGGNLQIVSLLLNNGGAFAATTDGRIKIVSEVFDNSGSLCTGSGGVLLANSFYINHSTSAVVRADGLAGNLPNNYASDSNGNIYLPSSSMGLISLFDTTNDGRILAANGGLIGMISSAGNIKLTANSLVQADGYGSYNNLFSGQYQVQPSQVQVSAYDPFSNHIGTVTNQGAIRATNGGSVQVYGDFTNLGSVSADGGVAYNAPNLLLYSSEFYANGDQFNNGGSISITNAATATLDANDIDNRRGAVITVSGSPGMLGWLPASQADINAFYTLNNAGAITATSGGIINLTALQTFTNGDLSGHGVLIADGAPVGVDGAVYPSAISVLADSLVNRALIQVSNGGQITVSANTISNTRAGRIDVKSGSALSITALQSGPALVQNSSGAAIHVDGSLDLWSQFSNSRGELVLEGPGSASGSGGLLSGEGVIDGDVHNVNGIVHPGNSPGVLTINGDYTQDQNGVLDITLLKLGGTPGHDTSLLDINGNVFLDGTIDFDFRNLDWHSFAAGNSIDFLEFTGSFQEGQNLRFTGGFPGSYSVLLDPNHAGMLEIMANTTVPEPGSYLLLSSAAVSLLALRRRRRSVSALDPIAFPAD